MTPVLARPAQPSVFAVFRNRSFTLLWMAQLISVAGSALSSLAAALLVYRLTGSAFSVGLMLLMASLPSLFVGLVAGVFVDRYDRKRIMIAADVSRALLVGAIPLLIPYGIAWLYVLVLLVSAIGQFFDPAHASMLPEIATDEELAAANSLMAISSQGVWALGFAAAGLIATWFPLEWAFYFDGLSFLVSAACIMGVRVAPLKVEGETSVAAVLSDLRAGMRFLTNTPILRSLFVAGVLLSFGIGITNALLLPFSLRALRATEFEYSLIEVSCSVGFVISSLLLARLADRLHEGQWIALSYLMMGLWYIVFALSPTVPIAIAALLVLGIISAPSVIGRQLVIQRNTPNEVRGRVNSAFFVMRDMLLAVGMAVAGLADLIDVRLLFIAASLLFVVAAALVLALPGLRQSLAEWRQAGRLLRNAHAAPGLGRGRAARPSDLDQLIAHIHALAGLSADDRKALLASSRVYAAPAGTLITRQGEIDDAIFFVLEGRALAGAETRRGYHAFNLLHPGEFFGEIAALTGTPRTATVLTQEPTTVLGMPAVTLRRIMRNPLVNGVFLELMAARLARVSAAGLLPIAGDDRQAARGQAPNPYATTLLRTQTSQYATIALQRSAEAYATMIIQGQVA